MNKTRRAAIAKIVSTLEQAYADLETLRDEEQGGYDNLPESFQNGEKGEAMQEAIDNMDTALDELDSAKDTLADLANG